MTDTPLLDEKLAAETITSLLKAIAGASGTCLGVAMSGRDHPNPDGALMDTFRDLQAAAQMGSEALRALSTRPATEVKPLDRLPTREEAAAAALVLSRCNGHDLDIWTDGSWPGDDFNDAIETLTREAPHE